MKIKKFIATNMPEAMKQIRAELGSDAVILNTKKVKGGGFLGFFKKNKIEVIAAIDPEPVQPTKREQVAKVKNVQPFMKTNKNMGDDDKTELLQEIKSIKQFLHQQSEVHHHFEPNYNFVYQYLINQEVEKEIAVSIMNAVKDHIKNEEPLTADIIKQTIVEIEHRMTNVKKSNFNNIHKVTHFIGPTGVGKTTTLAKIAAKRVLHDKRKVAFITMDTYRIAAIDQLKTYARILNVPIEVAYSIEDYQKAILKFTEYDDIFVDTAGRNFRNEKYVQELLNHMQNEVNTYIVLSLTAKPKDILEIYSQFKHVLDKEVIFTKFDETTQYGSILNVIMKHNVNVAYITNGQDVPEDIEEFNPASVSYDIVGGCFDE